MRSSLFSSTFSKLLLLRILPFHLQSTQLVSVLALEAACLKKFVTSEICSEHGAAKKKIAKERYDASQKTAKPQKKRSKIQNTAIYGENGGGIEDLRLGLGSAYT